MRISEVSPPIWMQSQFVKQSYQPNNVVFAFAYKLSSSFPAGDCFPRFPMKIRLFLSRKFGSPFPRHLWYATTLVTKNTFEPPYQVDIQLPLYSLSVLVETWLKKVAKNGTNLKRKAAALAIASRRQKALETWRDDILRSCAANVQLGFDDWRRWRRNAGSTRSICGCCCCRFSCLVLLSAFAWTIPDSDVCTARRNSTY